MINTIRKIKLSSKRKGSATVEAAMIFPMIMFILFGIIYLTIIHYQNNVLIAESMRAMNRAGAYWQYVDMDKYGKKTDYTNGNTPPAFDSSIDASGIINIEMIRYRNPYRTLVDVISEGISKLTNDSLGPKKKNSTQYVKTQISNIKFKQYVPEEGNFTTVENVKGSGFMFFGDDLKVNIGRAYINPLSGLSVMFLKQGNVTQKAMQKNITVSSVISNQAEFIRNLDTVFDLGSNIFNLVTPQKEGRIR